MWIKIRNCRRIQFPATSASWNVGGTEFSSVRKSNKIYSSETFLKMQDSIKFVTPLFSSLQCMLKVIFWNISYSDIPVVKMMIKLISTLCLQNLWIRKIKSDFARLCFQIVSTSSESDYQAQIGSSPQITKYCPLPFVKGSFNPCCSSSCENTCPKKKI